MARAGTCLDGALHEDREIVPVFRQQGVLLVGRHPVDAPRLGLGLEPADGEATRLLLAVHPAVGVAQHGQVGQDPVDRLRQA